MKSKVKYFFLLIGLLMLDTFAVAQQKRDQGGNLSKFYKQRMHFGFNLGFNQTDFRLYTSPNSKLYTNLKDTINYPDDTLTLKQITHTRGTGLVLGIVSDFRLHEYLRLRFLPNIAFGSRTLTYSWTGTDTFNVIQNVESTFINFPLLLKLQSKRLGNFGAYVVSGGSYSIDLASGKRQKANDQVVRLKSNDYYYEAGAGTDFYLPYFKLGLEFKLMLGLKNILIQDNTLFTKPINKLNSKIFMFSITFEG